MLPPSVGTRTAAELAEAVSSSASPVTFVAGTRAGSVWASPAASADVTNGCMPRVHSWADLPDELQAWAKAVANLVTESLSAPAGTGEVAGAVSGAAGDSGDDAADTGSGDFEGAGLTATGAVSVPEGVVPDGSGDAESAGLTATAGALAASGVALAGVGLAGVGLALSATRPSA